MSSWRAAARRTRALFVKEALQLLRDRATLGMLLGIPILQIILFGGAIELSPHSIDATVVSSDTGDRARIERLLRSQQVSPIEFAPALPAALAKLAHGTALVVVDADARPLRVYIDATNPVLATHAEWTIDRVINSISGPARDEAGDAPAIQVVRLYNPGERTQPFLVSGLLGLILTMSLVMMSALTIARERERGTLEALLSMPLRAIELWLGKLAPYLVLGLIQALLVLAVARFGFDIKPAGSITLLMGATIVFASANLALGFLFSCVARQQAQAMQMTFFFFLPSSLLSGFMFPFSAMPRWAKTLAEFLPLTHYLRIVRGLLLRGADTSFVLRELVPIGLLAVGAVGLSSLLNKSRASVGLRQ